MSETVRVVVSIANQIFQVTDADAAFGGDFPDDYRQTLITSTSDDIATLMLLGNMFPIIVPSGTSTEELVEERRRGLKALGVEDVDSVVDEAILRMKKDKESWAKRAIPFMS